MNLLTIEGLLVICMFEIYILNEIIFGNVILSREVQGDLYFSSLFYQVSLLSKTMLLQLYYFLVLLKKIIWLGREYSLESNG